MTYAFQACCPAAGAAASTGYLVPVDAPLSFAGPVVETNVAEPPPPSQGAALHEAGHAVHLHARGYRLARVEVGTRNFTERAPGEGQKMSYLEQIEAALAGDIGARYAVARNIHRMLDTEIDEALARVATGCHGTCDHCIAGVFARSIAALGTATDDTLARDVWRVAEGDVVEFLTSNAARNAIIALGGQLLAERQVDGEAAHKIINEYIEFGAFAEEGKSC